ncbi:interleukin-1 receptor-associated kinase 1 isoform X2 [Ambystoma mexicanum]|uniref:interleukin-1 receptor-associated kinase 1 isoform X2 n=1 Tax=Ambystoma mexicanum TaxID=8296 RepID=UPI0037E7A7D9
MSNLERQFLYRVPAGIMCRFCEVIASLDESEWTKFASHIVEDFTRLRLLEQKSRVTRTQDLMWHWANKNALVGDLLRVLNNLKLLRARDILLSWQPVSQANPGREDPRCAWKYNPDCPPPPYPDPSPSPTADPAKIGPPNKCPYTEETAALKSTECSLKSLPPPFNPPDSLMSSCFSGSTCSSDRTTNDDSSKNTSHGSPKVVNSENLFSRVSVLKPHGSLVWTLQELKEGTKNFCQSQMIGEGGFGHVYKATMRNTDYAIKKLKKDSELEWSTVKQSFLTEVEKLSGLRHPNIIDLAGYCVEEDIYCLVYLFLPNGSLEDRLHCPGRTNTLSWSQRLAIMLGVARAIQFLHLSQPNLIHGDVKSSNILLDEQLTPKLGDFGLARFRFTPAGAGQRSTAMWTKMVRGTMAYLPDEYVKMGKLTLELDTYSFGVVLLENLTGQQAIQNGGSGKTKYLDLVKEEEVKDQEEVEELKQKDPSFSAVRGNKSLRTGKRIYRKYLDTRAGQCPEEVGIELCHLACRCLESQKKRPKMQEVYEKLERLHSLLQCIPGGKDVGASLNSTSISSKELPSTMGKAADNFKDMILTPEENTCNYSPMWLSGVPSSSQPIARPSDMPLSRTTLSSGSCCQMAIDARQLKCSYPPDVHAGRGRRFHIGLDVCINRFPEMALGGEAFRTLPNGMNQPVESDESLSDTCISLSSPYQQRASPLTPDSGQGRSLSPAGCEGLALSQPSGGTHNCQYIAKNHLLAPGGYCRQADKQEASSCLYKTGALDSRASNLLLPGASHNGPPCDIVINPAKQRIVQKLALYEQGNINSMELLNSGSNPRLPKLPSQTPEECEDHSFYLPGPHLEGNGRKSSH